ncbi:MAG: acetate--CoA ligase [Flavobacteriaceae bacterium]|mgnify:CR=1 FL=1|nr:acetate--CoA ligase [Flavobacteriaceae bacterium]
MSHYHITSKEQYKQAYQESVENPEEFWSSIAENFQWNKKWDTVLNFDFSKPEINWFQGAKLNITENCIDRHLFERGNKTALLFEPNNPSEGAEHITYQQLHDRVCKMANVLKNQGIKKGDRVCLYLPMIPELAISVLACARIGAIHTVVFAGFSASALAARILDCDCTLVITSDGAFRGSKTIDLKGIVDKALKDCPDVKTILVAKRIYAEITLTEGRDYWLQPLLDKAETICKPEVMDAEDPLFILYTSGSTGKPKGMVHTTAGYMVYSAFTFKNVFQYEEEDVYWCTADIGWITGHSYIVYGPLANGATSVMFEGVPSHPDYGRFWDIVEKHKVNQFYTAPTAIRALAKQGAKWPKSYDLSSLKVLGTVGEPINEEAWHWYDEQIGKGNCPIVDTWWQTENGGILITSLPGITRQIPTYATLPMPGIQPCLMDEKGEEITTTEASGKLCIKFPWPSIARTIWGNHDRYRDTYFSAFKNKYFTGDGALRNAEGLYRITGRVDDVIIVSGHNLGTAPIEDAIDEHPNVSESAIVGFPHDIKGNALYGFVTLVDGEGSEKLKKEINNLISEKIGPIAKLDKIQFTEGLPKTRSGKIMRRILRKIASNETDSLGDISTLLNPEVVENIIKERLS